MCGGVWYGLALHSKGINKQGLYAFTSLLRCKERKSCSGQTLRLNRKPNKFSLIRRSSNHELKHACHFSVIKRMSKEKYKSGIITRHIHFLHWFVQSLHISIRHVIILSELYFPRGEAKVPRNCGGAADTAGISSCLR